jgi:hypothetical protein
VGFAGAFTADDNRQRAGLNEIDSEATMSPLFHRSDERAEGDGREHGHLPSLLELGSQVDAVAVQVGAVPVEQFAAQLMTRYFTPDHAVASSITNMVSVDTISWDLLPDNSGERLREPIPDAFFSLQDLVTEALQLLRTSGLVMERSYKVAQDSSYGQWLTGLVTTRRGRSALADNSVERILHQVYAPPA